MIFNHNEETQRLKWVFSKCINGAWGAEPDGETDIVCIRAADFDGRLGRLNSKERTLRSVDPATYEKLALRQGDIILEKSGGGDKQLVGRAAIYDGNEPSITSNFLARCRPVPGMEPSFVNYLLLAIYNGRGTFPHLKQSTGIQNLDISSFLDIRVRIPSFDTQQRIARFLDEKTSRIDELIKKKRTLLDRLAEKRQALITRAITKGLNPDIPMKPSGIDWQGSLPERWDSNWLKWSVYFSKKRSTDEEQETLPYISNEDITSWTGKLLIEEPKPAEADSRTFQKNDVLFNKLRPYLAKVYHATFDGVSSGELLCLRPMDSIEPRYLFYVLVSKGFIDTINAETFGVKMPRADWTIVSHQPIPLPPLDSQRRIAQFLDEKLEGIDATTEQVHCSIKHLSEYRVALIATAITGQHAELQ